MDKYPSPETCTAFTALKSGQYPSVETCTATTALRSGRLRQQQVESPEAYTVSGPARCLESCRAQCGGNRALKPTRWHYGTDEGFSTPKMIFVTQPKRREI